MSPPQPPKRPPSSNLLPAVDVVAPGAVHELRARPESDTAATLPPPAPDARPFPRPTLAGIRVPSLVQPPPLPSSESDEGHTLHGLGHESLPPAEPDDGDRPSEVDALAASTKTIAIKSELAEKKSQVDALRLQLEAVQLERKLASKARKQAGETSLRPLLLKLVAAATGLIVALTASVQALNQYVEWKLQDVKAKQQATDTVVKPAAATAASADRIADACRDWAKAFAEYDRQRFEKLGIIEPVPKGAAPTKAIECDQNVPLRGGPICKLLTAPPPLP